MRPAELTIDSFASYPPRARAFVGDNLATIREIPLPLLSIFLARFMDFDVSFPAEQNELGRQFRRLKEMTPDSFLKLMAPFGVIKPSEDLFAADWVNQPRRFNELLSAWLWSTHQIDAFREASHKYEDEMSRDLTGPAPATPRFVIAVIGKGVTQSNYALFRKLRSRGTMFSSIQPAGALDQVFDFVTQRAEAHPEPYAHWYIEGGVRHQSIKSSGNVTTVSFEELAPYAYSELNLIKEFVGRAKSGSHVSAEDVQSYVASLGPRELGLKKKENDACLGHFESSVFTTGAGTQIFSTTFVQWCAREALRRAQPVTMLTRYAPRQTMAPMSMLLKRDPLGQEKDALGSLIDADMGAYYTWINQSRLAGADEGCFLAWFEDHNLAVGIGPSLARGTVSTSPVTMAKILQWMS
ncbi:MAG TPA: hypothetical protein VGI45_27580 [Terracidiphilus sp.]|jgi:hypothetical protein